MPHKFFNISKNDFDNFVKNEIDIICKNKSNWEDYDKNCRRCIFKSSENMTNHIYKLSDLNIPIKVNDTIAHYVTYNIDGTYNLNRHNDACKITIIIYVNKTPNISETLYIEDNLVKDNYWSQDETQLRCMVMWSDDNEDGPYHSVIMEGNGKREVLCLFLG